jgi:cobalamin biosynthesis protein CbiG
MLVLGVGIEPGTPLAHLREAVDALGLHGVDDVDVVATIDTRAGEPAVLALATGRTLRTYPASALDAVHVPNPSTVVRRLIGTGSVAEAAALLAAREQGDGELVVPKRRGRGVTVAVCVTR